MPFHKRMELKAERARQRRDWKMYAIYSILARETIYVAV